MIHVTNTFAIENKVKNTEGSGSASLNKSKMHLRLKLKTVKHENSYSLIDQKATSGD